MNLNTKFVALCLVVSLLFVQSAHCTLTVILKDLTSADFGGGIISSNGDITDQNINFLVPSKKSVGISGWGGNPSYFSSEIAQKSLSQLAAHSSASEIEEYVVKANGNNYYRYAFMNTAGTIEGAVAPYCDNTHVDCAFYSDATRSIVVAAGGQVPGSILKTFNRLQALQDARLRDFKNGLPVMPFACYLANAMAVSQEFGAETETLAAVGIVLDLIEKPDLVKFTSRASVETEIVTQLKVKVSQLLNLNCL